MEKFRNQRQNFSASAACLRGKLWAKALGRSLTTQRKQALLLDLADNIYKSTCGVP
jgi:hypothetical protein